MEVVNKIEMVSVTTIKPYHRNARQNEETVAKLVELIPLVGFNVPLVLDRNNVIVKGHSRWKAAIRIGMTEIPCVYTDADEETIKLDRLADNKVGEFSKWNDDMLRSELSSLNLEFDYNLADLKFNFAGLEASPPIHESAMGEDPDDGYEYETPPSPSYTGATGSPVGDSPSYYQPTSEAIPQPEEPFITREDVLKTVGVQQLEYKEVVCSKCGNIMFVKKGA